MDSAKPQKVFILGGTGQCGRYTIQYALESGYEVTSLTRNPEKAPKHTGNFKWVKGNIYDKASFVESMRGHDIVLSCVGSDGLGKTTIFTEGLKNVFEAMEETKINRIIFVGASFDHPDQGFFGRFFTTWVLKNIRRDYNAFDEWLAKYKGPVEWTCVKPFRLVEKGRTGKYHVAKNKSKTTPGWTFESSIPDVADFLIKEITEKKWINQDLDIGFQKSR